MPENLLAKSVDTPEASHYSTLRQHLADVFDSATAVVEASGSDQLTAFGVDSAVRGSHPRFRQRQSSLPVHGPQRTGEAAASP